MFLQVLAENQYVIQLNQGKSVQHVTENIIHQTLKDERGISYAKWLTMSRVNLIIIST